MQAADLGPVPDSEKTQTPVDLFLIVAGANLVATTLQTGASLAPAFGLRQAALLAFSGVVLGTALVAALTPLGPRLGVPSVIACRAALGLRGGALVSLILYVTNFAWIAVNNVIAASACARLFGGPASVRFWALGLGLLATAVVAGGPRAVSHADRVAVPAPPPRRRHPHGRVLPPARRRHGGAGERLDAGGARPRRRDRLPGLVAPHLRGLPAVHALAPKSRGRRVPRPRAHEPLVRAARLRRGARGGLDESRRDARRGRPRRPRRRAPRPRDAHDELREHLHVGSRVEEPRPGRAGPRVRLDDRRRRRAPVALLAAGSSATRTSCSSSAGSSCPSAASSSRTSSSCAGPSTSRPSTRRTGPRPGTGGFAISRHVRLGRRRRGVFPRGRRRAGRCRRSSRRSSSRGASTASFPVPRRE